MKKQIDLETWNKLIRLGNRKISKKTIDSIIDRNSFFNLKHEKTYYKANYLDSGKQNDYFAFVFTKNKDYMFIQTYYDKEKYKLINVNTRK